MFVPPALSIALPVIQSGIVQSHTNGVSHSSDNGRCNIAQDMHMNSARTTQALQWQPLHCV